MIIKRHKEVICDICGKRIDSNRFNVLPRCVRIKKLVVKKDEELSLDRNIDLCWGCYSRLIKEVKANVYTQNEV